MIRLTRENGPCTVFTVFGSPFSQFKGNWAFGYGSSKAAALWNHIPPEVDIVVTHTPPQSYCDQKPDGKFVGCHALRDKLSRIRPPLAICGHVHEGRGYSRVRWQNVDTVCTGSEEHPGTCGRIDRETHDPLPPRGSKKLNLVDLTGKRRDPLDNHGFSGEVPGVDLFPEPANSSIIPFPDNVKTTGGLFSDKQSNREDENLLSLRKETCIINAAIMATSWPHRGGKQFNAPIVVDIELPTWCSQEKESTDY